MLKNKHLPIFVLVCSFFVGIFYQPVEVQANNTVNTTTVDLEYVRVITLTINQFTVEMKQEIQNHPSIYDVSSEAVGVMDDSIVKVIVKKDFTEQDLMIFLQEEIQIAYQLEDVTFNEVDTSFYN